MFRFMYSGMYGSVCNQREIKKTGEASGEKGSQVSVALNPSKFHFKLCRAGRDMYAYVPRFRQKRQKRVAR